MRTNECGSRPESDGSLRRSYLVLQRIIPGRMRTGLARLWGAKANTLRGFLAALTAALLSLLPYTGQFLLEESRLLEAAEMAEKAARLDSGEFDVVFSAAHMLR